MLLDGSIDNLGIKTHTGHIERIAVHQLGRVSLHDIYHCLLGIGHVHHVHIGSFLQGTHKLFTLHCCVVDFYSVVGGAATRQGLPADEAGETHRTGVDSKASEIIVAQQLTGHLGHAIDGVGTLNSVLWGIVMRRRGAEGSDTRRREYGTAKQTGHFETIHQRANAHIPSQHRIQLGCGTQDSGQVVDSVDVVLLHGSGNLHNLGAVDALHRAALVGVALQRTQITAHDIAVAVNVSQITCQLGTYLSAGTHDKDFFHRYSILYFILNH